MTDEDGASLSEKFNLNVMDMKYLRSFEAIEVQNQTYQDVYKKHLFKVSHKYDNLLSHGLTDKLIKAAHLRVELELDSWGDHAKQEETCQLRYTRLCQLCL